MAFGTSFEKSIETVKEGKLYDTGRAFSPSKNERIGLWERGAKGNHTLEIESVRATAKGEVEYTKDDGTEVLANDDKYIVELVVRESDTLEPGTKLIHVLKGGLYPESFVKDVLSFVAAVLAVPIKDVEMKHVEATAAESQPVRGKQVGCRIEDKFNYRTKQPVLNKNGEQKVRTTFGALAS